MQHKCKDCGAEVYELTLECPGCGKLDPAGIKAEEFERFQKQQVEGFEQFKKNIKPGKPK